MIKLSQFNAGNWTYEHDNLSSGEITTVRLTKHVIKSRNAHPIDSRCILCFDNQRRVLLQATTHLTHADP